MSGIEYPVKINDISKFERQNSNISVGVFALHESNNIKSIYPVYYNYSNYKNREHKIDLLYIEKNQMTHYCLIKNLESLLHNNRNQAFICRNCMSIFSSITALGNHEEKCIEHKLCKLILPKEGDKLEFNKHHFKSCLPVVIYADFEANNQKIHTSLPPPEKSYTRSILKQNAISFGIHVKSDYSNLFYFSILYIH